MTQCGQGMTADIADVARVIAERRPRHMVVDFVDPDAPRGLNKATSTL